MRTGARTAILLQILAGAVLLAAMSFAYGRTFIYHDSGTYYLYGEHIYSEITAAINQNRAQIIPLGQVEQDYVGARSPTYSLIFFIVTSNLTLWGVTALQALACSWLLFALSGLTSPPFRVAAYWIMVAVLTAATPLSYFISFAMPDIFAGIGVLCLILLLLPRGQSRATRIGAWLLLVLSASFHATHVAILAAAGLVGIAALAVSGSWKGSDKWIASAALIGGLILGASIGPAYQAAERSLIGHPIGAPPFVTARVLADGTGVDYLKEACRQPDRFALCDYQMPEAVDASSFLWAPAEQGGGYTAADASTRARLRAEQTEFVLGTFASRPVGQLSASLRNWATQLVQIDVLEPIMDPRTQESFRLFEIEGSLPGEAYVFPAEPALEVVRRLFLIFSAFGLILIWVASRADRVGTEDRAAIATIIGIVLTAVLVNAAVCGAMSEPWPRYQARIIWIVPAALLLLTFRFGPKLLRDRLPLARTGLMRLRTGG
ncbi:hypothetical protein DF286_11655 [Sphingosinicella humi]|uniref:Glycosyltransferase RgtA/B/C/D-like domain-containing protein n=2 Tax=Allosphingosinicella humi TaxID=2068657 RepID=A0A2U2J566_9SPHN|nr:hypothetical protein DF286_11655 [Sphingosinicella humi]